MIMFNFFMLLPFLLIIIAVYFIVKAILRYFNNQEKFLEQNAALIRKLEDIENVLREKQ